jgi:hypothetical protein
MRRTQDLERDEAVVAAQELLALDRESDFEGAGAPKLVSAARQFAPEVDRRPRLRAR